MNDNDFSGVEPSDATEKITSNPQLFLTPAVKVSRQCHTLLCQIYNEQTARLSGKCGPSSIASMEAWSVDFLWMQLNARNEQVLPRLQVWRTRCQQALHNGTPITANQHQQQTQQASGVRLPLDTATVVEKGTTASRGDSDDSPGRGGDYSSHCDSDDTEPPKQPPTETKLPEAQEDELDDGFFKQSDLEAFISDAEELKRQGKLFDDEDINSEDEEQDNGQQDDSESDDESNDLDIDSNQSKENYHYNDFFRSSGGEKPKSLRLRTPVAEKSLIEDEEEVEVDDQTPLEQQWARSRSKIEKLENENIGDKPWHLKGEVKGADRPENSLLEAVLDHEVTARPAPVITEETTADIESVIRQRIFDEIFDDVERKLPPDTLAENQEKKRPGSVAQEKSKVGLGEIYEKEYAAQLEKSRKENEEEEEEETPQQAEVNQLYHKLCDRLDQLSNLHFTAKPRSHLKDMEARPNLPAIMAEEAIPGAVSNADLLGPAEVYDGAKQPVADNELSKEERKRRRNKSKHDKRASTKLINQKRKAAEQMDPDLKERNAKKRALEALKDQGTGAKVVFHKNARRGEVRKPSQEYTDSAKFFKSLQESAKQDIQNTKKGISNQNQSGTGRTDGRSLKL